MAVTGLDHVLLDIRSKAVLRSENGRQTRFLVTRQPVDDVVEGVVDRRGVADDPDPFSVQGGRPQKTFDPQLDAHAERLFHTRISSCRLRGCGRVDRLRAFGGQAARFARAESRSSLCS